MYFNIVFHCTDGCLTSGWFSVNIDVYGAYMVYKYFPSLSVPGIIRINIIIVLFNLACESDLLNVRLKQIFYIAVEFLTFISVFQSS